MIDIGGKNIADGLPYINLKVVNELLSFEDSPMIVHYADEMGNDLLAYWVDFDENNSRWLYWKIDKDTLYFYLRGISSLKHILQNISTEFIFFVDIDREGNYSSIKILNGYSIPEKYYPGENSFYNLGLSDFYFEYLNSQHHLYFLRKNTYVFHLEAANDIHGSTVGGEEAANFLRGVTTSMKEFIYYKAFHVFKDIIPNPQKLNVYLNKIKDRLAPRVSALSYGSFEIGLAIDTVAIVAEYEINSDWKNTLIEEYKNDVIDVNYNSDEDAKIIAEKYDIDTRKKIYTPFIKAIENEGYTVEVNDIAKQRIRSYQGHSIKESVKEIVIPKPTKEEEKKEDDKRFKLYKLVIALEEGQDITNIKFKDLKDGLLFGDTEPETSYIIESPLDYNNKSYILKKGIKCHFALNADGIYKIYNSELELESHGVKFKDVEHEFKDSVGALIEGYYKFAEETGTTRGDTRYNELEKYL